MNRITGMALVALGLVVLDQSASAQRPPAHSPSGQASSAQNDCKDAKGTLFEFWGGGGDSPGTLNNSGWLDGATQCVFSSAGFSTPVPTQFTYTCAYTITTGKGQLKGTRTFLSDVAIGWSMDITIIDPNANTGIFAGATGVLYSNQIKSNTAPAPTTYLSEINGKVCLVP